MSMSDTIVSFETAKLAKEKGFESDVSHSIYTEIGKLKDPIAQMDLMRNQESIQEYFKLIKSFPSAPTQSLLQKWLREVYKLFLTIDIEEDKYFYMLVDINRSKYTYIGEDDAVLYDNYEDALEAGLQEALKLLP